MATEGVIITKEIFLGISALVNTLAEAIGIANLADLIKTGLRDVYNIAVASVILIILFVAGITVASCITAAATWQTKELLYGNQQALESAANTRRGL